MPRHRAAVTDEEVLAATVELEPRPPGHRPARVVDHRPDVRHLLQRRALQHVVVAGREKCTPARQVAGRRPQLAERAGAAEIELRLQPNGVRVRLDEVAARPPARTRRASSATVRAERGSAPAAPPPRCRRARGRRPRRAARTRGSSSATRCRGRAPAPRPRCRRAAPRATAPSSSPRSRPAARAGGRRSARACGRASARARCRADASSADRRARARLRRAAGGSRPQ